MKGRSDNKVIRLKIPIGESTLVVFMLYFDFYRSGTRNVKGRDQNTVAFIFNGDVVKGAGFVEGV